MTSQLLPLHRGKFLLSTLSLALLAGSNSLRAAETPAPLAVNLPVAMQQASTHQAPVEPKPQQLQQQQPDELFYQSHSARQKQLSASAAAAVNCDSVYSGYGSKTGQALVDHILANPSECIDALYSGDATAIAAAQAEKMYSVANATAALAQTYDPATSTDVTLGKLYYFLRTGYYVQYYNSAAVPTYPSWVTTAVRNALDKLFANPHFYTSSDLHGRNIQDALVLIDSAGENARYLYVVKQWLTRWDSTAAASWNMRSAVNSIFTVLFRGHYDNAFVQAATADSALIQQLGNFASADWMLGSDAAFLQENAASELSRFLQYPNSSVASTVDSQVRNLLSRYSMDGLGANVWIKTAATVDYYGRCADFSICGFAQQLEQQVLSAPHACNSSMKFRVQDMTASELAGACDSVVSQESYFHQFLVTHNQPVADDLNSALEMVVFNSSDDYGLYAGLFYGINTDNGGMYLEGNPAQAGNQARFIAYEAEWLRPDFQIWNLTHEMVHYLDGRFNLKGDFGDARTDSHKTVWWIEGLAEYVSKKNRNDYAVSLASSRKYTLSAIMANNYDSGTERIYYWGYLAVRFMFEQHPEKVNELLAFFRTGDYDNYLSVINAIGSQYDSEWSAWLGTVTSNDTTPDVTLSNPTDPVDPPSDKALVSGQAKTALTAQQGNWLHYYIDVPQGQTSLTIEQSGGSGDADLYVKFNQEPAARSYDCRPYRSGNTEQCEFAAPAAGRWYVSSYAYSSFDGVSLTATLDGGTSQPDACATQSPVSYVQLAPEQQYCVASASNNDYTYFYLYNNTANARYRFNLSGQGQGNADLYFSSSSWPTADSYQQASTSSGSNETLTTPALPVGWVYISIHANAERPATTLSVSLN